MVCDKCNYIDEKEAKIFGKTLCKICAFFAPKNENDFYRYVEEKIDWKILETFRKYGQKIGKRQKEGMEKKAKDGKIMSRIPFGYSLIDGHLVENENSSKIHLIFKEFLETDISLNKLAKRYGFSTNGLKKILKNRTYLGEIKFGGKFFKGTHKPLISPEIFYAVQRKLEKKINQ